MKKFFLIVLIISSFSLLNSFKNSEIYAKHYFVHSINSDYSEGWKDGYCEGWKDVKEKNAVCPVTPVCPVPEVGKNTYKDGYNRGFKKGMSDASKK